MPGRVNKIASGSNYDAEIARLSAYTSEIDSYILPIKAIVQYNEFGAFTGILLKNLKTDDVIQPEDLYNIINDENDPTIIFVKLVTIGEVPGSNLIRSCNATIYTDEERDVSNYPSLYLEFIGMFDENTHRLTINRIRFTHIGSGSLGVQYISDYVG